jgi:hypothetical protein
MKDSSSVRAIVVIFFAMLLGVPLWAALQEKTAEKPAAAPAAEAAKPGMAEMERLKFYLGEWDYTETYPKSGSFRMAGLTPACITASSDRAGNRSLIRFIRRGRSATSRGCW